MITSFSNQMYLKFVSDATESEKGFEIEWDLLTIGKHSQSCMVMQIVIIFQNV